MKKLFIFCSILFIFYSGIKVNAQEVKINHDGTDGLVIESDGTIMVEGTATTWDDLRVPLTSAEKQDATKTDFIGSTGLKIDWFSKKDVNEMYFVAQLPHTYVEGTDIFPHIHWIPKSDGTGSPSFGLEYAWVNLGEAITGTTTIYGDKVVIPGNNDYTGSLVAATHYITPFDLDSDGLEINGIDGTDKKISSMLVCRIFRDPNDAPDDYTADVGMLEVDFHYQVNTMGSREPFTK